MMTIKKKNLLTIIICLAVFLNNISQLPIFVDLKITSPIAITGWAAAFLAIVLDVKFRVHSIIFPSITLVFCAFFWIVTNNNYFSEINRNFFLSVIIFIMGYSYASFLDRDSFRRIGLFYVISTVIVSISVWYSYLLGTNSLSIAEYAYTPKNSLSQIILTAIILLFVSFIMYRRSNNRKIIYAITILALLFEVFVLFTLRSRATLIGFLLSVIIFILSKDKGTKTRKYKNIVIVILLILTVTVFVSESFYTIVFDNIIFAGRNPNNLNELSSGRINIISSFPKLIKGHWLTGIGNYYLECFPLAELLNNGIIVGLSQILFALSPLIWWANKGRYILCKEYRIIFACASVVYIINGFFECLAPFGPGAKCSFLWMLYGIMSCECEWNRENYLLIETEK